MFLKFHRKQLLLLLLQGNLLLNHLKKFLSNQRIFPTKEKIVTLTYQKLHLLHLLQQKLLLRLGGNGQLYLLCKKRINQHLIWLIIGLQKQTLSLKTSLKVSQAKQEIGIFRNSGN